MQTKHTPGPWHRNIKPATHYNTIFAGRNTHVTRLAVEGKSEEEVEANCALIVAAPDLLKTLREIVAAVEVGEVDGYSPSGDWYKEARAALDKATGTTTPTPKD
jgi:hypothetical protein